MHRQFPPLTCGAPARFLPRLAHTLTLTLAGVAACLCATLARAQVDTAINQNVWKLLYGVTDAQLASPAWLAADADGDGIANGAELAAGTNPFNRASTHAITATARNADGTFSLSFPTVAGKFYVVQGSGNLANAAGWTALTPAVQILGDGTVKTLTTPVPAGPTFYRVVVQDIDTDGDGVSDWAEIATGFDPASAHTHGAAQDDHTALASDLPNENVVTLAAPKAAATQPPDAATPASDTGTVTITRGGSLHFTPLTVALNWSGTAAANVDYAAMPATVTFPPKAGSVTLTLVPLANSTRRTAGTATAALLAGNGYTAGTNAAASVLISPASNPTGTGLTATYYTTTWNALGAGYSPSLFSAANLKITRLDPTIDFDWTNNPPGPGIDHDLYTARWVGQVQPQYSETYYFDTFTDDGVKLWVNGQLLIDGWGYQWPDRLASITLKAGVLYDIKMEFYQGNGGSYAHLYWSSPSQPRQIIPAKRLYPGSVTPAPPAITSPASAVGFVNQPFSFQVTASTSGGAPVTFARGANGGSLPPGLSLNTATGLISGTPTAAGSYQAALTATSAYGTGAGVLNVQILSAGSGVTRELWTAGVTGSLVANIPLSSIPTSTDTTLATLEDTTAYPDNTGERLRGYFTPPTTGNYYFWLAADNNAEFWLSDDAEPVNKLRRAVVTAPGTNPRQWSASTQTVQKSPWLSLVAGQKYYYEVLHNCGSGTVNDHLSVGWFLDPTGTTANPLPDGSGVVPGYVLTRYDYPATASAAGTLYASNLSPQSAVASTATGSANLRVSPDNTQAVLHFSYSGLSSPRTAYHIHIAPDQTGSGPIVFDLDDIDKFHPELKTADGGYVWNITAVGAYSAAQIVSAIQAGTTYFNVHTVNYPAGEIRGFLSLVQGSQSAPVPVADPGFTDDSATDAGAARFLHQAAFGAAPVDLAAVLSGGYAAWIAAQFALPATHHLPALLANTYSAPGDSFYSDRTMNTWWRESITAPDQLRQRVAFALSEILVVSANSNLSGHGESLSSYYDALLDNAFGNFRDVLRTVTLHPAMGIYLNALGNDRGSIASGLRPNENYAREILQLFSLGLNRQWPDGTLVLDSQGNLVPTYTQATIEGFARVFTGWTWNQASTSGGRLPSEWYPPENWTSAMTLVPTHHELGSKTLLDNVVLPAAAGYNPIADPVAGSQADPNAAAFDLYGAQDLEKALDSIFNHPNCGPFICRQLIQRLVKSSPSPAYLQRVVARFNDDGTTAHARGSMQAVLKAILLDGEARNLATALASATAGKQREPILRIANAARTFLAGTNTGTYSQTAGGGPLLKITTQTAHNLSPYDNVSLDFTGNATGTPPVEPATNPQSRDGYQVLDTPAPTANTFYVGTPGMEWNDYTIPAGSKTVTFNTGGPAAGNKVYVHTYNGTIPDGFYPVTGNPDANHFTITSTMAAAPTQDVHDWGQMYRLYGYVEVDNGGTPAVTTVTFGTYDNHNLVAGQTVYAAIPAGSSAQVQAGLFTVARVIDPLHFTVNLGTLANEEYFGNVTYFPQQPPIFTRSGNVKLSTSKFDMSFTDDELSQSPLNSPTVFNFFYPDYKYPGTLAAGNVTTPEFQLTTDTNVIGLTNQIAYTIFSSGNRNGLSAFKSGALCLDLSPYLRAPYVSGTTVNVALLVGKLGDVLTGGALTDATKNAIIAYVSNATNFPPANSDSVRDRVRACAHFIMVSPDYAVQR